MRDKKDNFKGMLLQTLNMKKDYESISLLNIGIPVFLIVAEDGNCQTEIVCLCSLTTEDKRVLNGFWKLSEKIIKTYQMRYD